MLQDFFHPQKIQVFHGTRMSVAPSTFGVMFPGDLRGKNGGYHGVMEFSCGIYGGMLVNSVWYYPTWIVGKSPNYTEVCSLFDDQRIYSHYVPDILMDSHVFPVT